MLRWSRDVVHSTFDIRIGTSNLARLGLPFAAKDHRMGIPCFGLKYDDDHNLYS